MWSIRSRCPAGKRTTSPCDNLKQRRDEWLPHFLIDKEVAVVRNVVSILAHSHELTPDQMKGVVSWPSDKHLINERHHIFDVVALRVFHHRAILRHRVQPSMSADHP